MKYADVTVTFLVRFDDDETTDLKDQARDAALCMIGIPEWEADISILGEVRDSE